MEPETKKMAMIAAGVFFVFVLIMHLRNSPDYGTTTTTTTHKSATVVTNPNVYRTPYYNPHYNRYKNQYYN